MARRTVLGYVLVAVAALALVAAGCGGGDGTEVTTSDLSKAQFVKQADAVCKKGEEQIQEDFVAYAKKHKDLTKPTDSDYAELIDAVFVPNVNREVEELRDLGAPAGDEEQVEAMLVAREENVAAAEAEPKKLVSESSKVFAEASKLAKEYGLKTCGNR